MPRNGKPIDLWRQAIDEVIAETNDPLNYNEALAEAFADSAIFRGCSGEPICGRCLDCRESNWAKTCDSLRQVAKEHRVAHEKAEAEVERLKVKLQEVWMSAWRRLEAFSLDAAARERERCLAKFPHKFLCTGCGAEWLSPSHTRCESCGDQRSDVSTSQHMLCDEIAAAIREGGDDD